MLSIAVVEDDPSMRAYVTEYLAACGHRVIGCEDAPALDRALSTQLVDILVLDVNLPGENGFSIAKRMREQSTVGIIMLTARELNVDRVLALELGADVYLTKPIDLRELEAQARALGRRLAVGSHRREDGGPLAARASGTWVYHQLAWALVCPSGVSLKLTANERVLVSLLTAHPGEPVPRAAIFRALGKENRDPMDRSIDSMVRRLRAKSVEIASRELPIDPVHGIGYVFTAPVVVR